MATCRIATGIGVTPFGVADIHNYRLWVGEPALPADVINVGQRTEPNLELLQQMAPSLILLSQGYGPSPEKLAPIAPTMSFAFNEQGSSPLAVGKTHYRHWGSVWDWRRLRNSILLILTILCWQPVRVYLATRRLRY